VWLPKVGPSLPINFTCGQFGLLGTIRARLLHRHSATRRHREAAALLREHEGAAWLTQWGGLRTPLVRVQGLSMIGAWQNMRMPETGTCSLFENNTGLRK
jgi:hypothetical protein